MRTTHADAIHGGLFGLAIGDALGAPVEFLSRRQILASYGPSGITDLVRWGNFPAGTYTDDTQMSLATLQACLGCEQPITEAEFSVSVRARYADWRESQTVASKRRAPGNTCLEALRTGEPIVDSKGCGGVMRTAPIGWMVEDRAEAYRLGCLAARVTHGHPTGYITGGVFAAIICDLMHGQSILGAADLELLLLEREGLTNAAETCLAMRTALMLVEKANLPPEDAIAQLGEGWVAEEALAIAIYAACYIERRMIPGLISQAFAAGVCLAANHDGDSDSTASMAGAILGAACGYTALPASWCRQVEGARDLERMASAVLEVSPFTQEVNA